MFNTALFVVMGFFIVECCSLASAEAAVDIQQIVILGDSYSDNGNTYAVSKNTYPGPAYTLGRFSNGPTWPEYFAMRLGINTMDPTHFRNYAYGQAQMTAPVTLVTHATTQPTCYINEGNYVDRVGAICNKPWQHFYFDRIHPTTYTYKLMSDDLYALLMQSRWLT